MGPHAQPRQPQGTPVGGQFAGRANPESDLELTDTQSGRTDVHRPVEFNPEDYEYVGAFDNHPEPGSYVGPGGEFEVAPGVTVHGTNFANAERRYLGGLLETSTGTRYGDGSQCDHCGARIRYVAVYRHKPTGDHIAVGETCADGRLPLDKATFDRLRKSANLDRKRQARKNAARAKVAELDGPVATLLDRETDPDSLDGGMRRAWDHEIVSDIRRRLWTYGEVSDRQIDLVHRIRERETAEPPPPVPEVPVPEGTYVVEGTVKAMRWQESRWGGAVKMLVEVETPNGNYRVWGSLPKALSDLYEIDSGPRLANGGFDVKHIPKGVGKKIQFKAGVERSDREESFGFFSRPTQAKVIEDTATEE